MQELNNYGQRLVDNLRRLDVYERQRVAHDQYAEKVNVVGAGRTLTAAYEQLRNAAENTEEHLLLQNAIKRFLRQAFVTRDDQLVSRSGYELIVELTLAGYLQNNSIPVATTQKISAVALEYYRLYETLQQDRRLRPEASSRWTLDVAAVLVENMLADHGRDTVFVDFVYEETAPIAQRVLGEDHSDDDKASMLLSAIHEALLKSDGAVVRTTLLQRYQIATTDVEQFIAFNQKVDTLFDLPVYHKLVRTIDRQGAPFRIVRRMFDDIISLGQLLPKKSSFLSEYERQISKEYERIGDKTNKAVIRSIIFLVITKFAVGLSIEVPYDLISHHQILWLPLIINLIFPPLYMVLLRATLQMPSAANTTALVDRIEAMLYGDGLPLPRRSLSAGRFGPLFSAMYILTSLVVFAAVLYVLLLLGFSLVHMAIFFVFLSTASFLGFRISRNIRELEVVRSRQNGLTFIRDMLYLPFVVVGQWMSEKYGRLNIVAVILDMVIELPLKTVLRLVRQWAAFIDERKDNI